MAQTLTYDFRAGVSVGFNLAVNIVADSAEANYTAATNTVSVTRPVHRLAALAGMFADDPMWPEYLEAIRSIRAEEDVLEVI